MRCPACNVDNSEGATACAACGAPLTAPSPSRRVRRHADETQIRTGLAWTAYRCGVASLIPGVGLALGPVAFTLGAWAMRRQAGKPVKGLGAAGAAVLLGGLNTIANWTGLALMLQGLGQSAR
jgi:hypothetical protein